MKRLIPVATHALAALMGAAAVIAVWVYGTKADKR